MSAHAEINEDCGPFEERYANDTFQVAAADPGLEPASASGAQTEGPIVTLPAAPAISPDPPGGEALLALPKGPDGSLPTDFELGEGAKIVESFFSPILCATVARVVGAEGAAPETLVAGVPDGATLVANSVYVSAQEAVTPAPAPTPQPDPYRPLQYALDQLEVDPSRSVSRGRGARVAVLDSAPAVEHRDLGNVSVSTVEGGPPNVPAVHGTLVAGVIGAIEQNGFGMAGIGPEVEVVAVPVCTPQGATASDRCLLFDLLRGLDRAWSQEAFIVNLSIVGPSNPLLERAMSRLDQLGAVVVASAGNEGTDAPRYPAAYPSVIGVGAIDRERKLSARSNRGASAELSAPGVEVLSAVPGDVFAFGTGTSFAAAHVSGVLGLLVGAGADPVEARAALFQAAHAAAGSITQGSVPLPPVCDVLARLGKPCSLP
jgi:thermitase